MNVLDIFFLLAVLVSVILGIVKGFLREIFSIIFLFISLMMALLFYPEGAKVTGRWVHSEGGASCLSFFLIFSLFLIIGSLVSLVIKKIFVKGGLQTADRWFGAIFGLARGILISAVVIFGLMTFSVEKELMARSSLTPAIRKSVQFMINLMPNQVQKEIKSLKPDDRKKTD